LNWRAICYGLAGLFRFWTGKTYQVSNFRSYFDRGKQ
jgi:hypothetical protein